MSNKACFVVSPIGEEESDERRRADQVLKHILRPAAEPYGYSVQRADEIDTPGMITTQVVERVSQDDLLIADLTNQNPNVFYELALRHALRKPYIQVIQKGERMPFDVAGIRTIQIDTNDLDVAENARKEIQQQIKSIEDNPSTIETPFSVALEMQNLRESDDPEKQAYADLINEIGEIKSYLANFSMSSTEETEARLRRIENQIQRRLAAPTSKMTHKNARDLLDAAANDSRSLMTRLGALSSLLGDIMPGARGVLEEANKQFVYGSFYECVNILASVEQELLNDRQELEFEDFGVPLPEVYDVIRYIRKSMTLLK
jgi:hypothetical protein